MTSFISRHPVVSFLGAAYAIFWANWIGALLIAPQFLGLAPLRPLGQVLAFASTGLLALSAVLVSKGALAYHREHRQAKSLVDA